MELPPLEQCNWLANSALVVAPLCSYFSFLCLLLAAQGEEKARISAAKISQKCILSPGERSLPQKESQGRFLRALLSRQPAAKCIPILPQAWPVFPSARFRLGATLYIRIAIAWPTTSGLASQSTAERLACSTDQRWPVVACVGQQTMWARLLGWQARQPGGVSCVRVPVAFFVRVTSGKRASAAGWLTTGSPAAGRDLVSGGRPQGSVGEPNGAKLASRVSAARKPFFHAMGTRRQEGGKAEEKVRRKRATQTEVHFVSNSNGEHLEGLGAESHQLG